jgi:MoaA/NifB/PqqE/SkfB family radical SAM enzyme
VSSQAFNRPAPWPLARQEEIALSKSEIARLESELEATAEEWAGTGFVLESRERLFRISRHFRALHGLCEAVAPQCNAPWVSAVVEASGVVRPCFFQPPIGRLAGNSLLSVLNGPAAVAFRANLDVASNATCRQCVCSLNWTASPAR